VNFDFHPPAMPANEARLRAEVRAFVSSEVPPEAITIDPLFFADKMISRKIGDRGWIGMTWPVQYGGGGRLALERYIVLEELLSAGVPMAAHLTADRQSGPLILRFGSDRQRAEFLPRIAAGTCSFCIGMSEPDAGSDLSNVRTRATRTEGGWLVNGAKVWTSNAHIFDYMITLVRTGERTANPREGLTQMIVDLAQPGIAIRPIRNMAGNAHFNEVLLEDHFVPDAMVIGQPGDAWGQLMTELALERSGPERFLSSYRLLAAAIDHVGPEPSEAQAVALGRLVAHGATVRGMSVAVNAALQDGYGVEIEAAMVKDLGTNWEQAIPTVCHEQLAGEPDPAAAEPYPRLLASTLLHAPSFSLRGGTREIVRGIIARGLGLR